MSATKSGDSIKEFLHNISDFSTSKFEFKVVDHLTFSIAARAKDFVKDPKALMWSDKTITFYAEQNFTPKNTKHAKYELKYETGGYKFYSLKKDYAGFSYKTMTEDEKFLARVIYSETSTVCSPLEVKLVCKVILNRIGKKDFANGGKTPQTAIDVVKVKDAFSCIDDPKNSNWKEFKPELNFASRRACIYAHYILKNEPEALNLPSGYDDIMYYHDKSISCPKSWTNKYWRPVLVKETDHFKFYKVAKNKK